MFYKPFYEDTLNKTQRFLVSGEYTQMKTNMNTFLHFLQ